MPDEICFSNQSEVMEALNDARIKLGMTLGDLDAKSGVSTNTFFAWRREQRSPTLCSLVALAETVGFTVVLRRKADA